MADKEATVFIVDVGRSMGEKSNGREETNLDWCMHYIWEKITTTVLKGRKSDIMLVMGLRTDETNHNVSARISEDPSYSNLTVFQPFSQFLMPTLRDLREKIKPSNTNEGDAIWAVVLAIQMILLQCKKLKYIKKIILVTDGTGELDPDHDLENIAKKLKEEKIQLVIVGVDFDSPEYGFEEKNKSPKKLENEETLKQLAEDSDGAFGTMAEAIAEMVTPEGKITRPISSYKGELTLGDADKYDSAMRIPVERYPRVMIARPATATKFTVRSNVGPGEGSTQSSATVPQEDADGDVEMGDAGGGLAAIKNARTYQIEDKNAAGGKRDVESGDLAKGYSYGRTAVFINESERNITDLETQIGLEIVGFVDASKFDRYMELSRASMIIPSKTNEKGAMAFSSFVHALWESDTYAIARFVAKSTGGRNKPPVLLLVAPSIDSNEFECLVDVELPYAEDIRQYKFPPLDKVVTVSGKNPAQHRFLPNDDLLQSMSDYVDRMDLSTFGENDEGGPGEYAPMGEVYSPVLHRINQVIKWRAVHPNEEIPPVPEILTKYSQPPEDLLAQAKSSLEKAIKAGGVKRVPPKQKGRKRAHDTEKPLSGIDVDALLGSSKRTKISAENAVPEFKQMLATTEDVKTIREATKQMAEIVKNFVRHSLGDRDYGRAVEALNVMRSELTELEEPGLYNEMLRDLKKRMFAGELGGERKEMWWKIRANRLGLIDKKLSLVSDVSEQDAKAFLSAK
ncbi:putative Ku family DNA helicase [Aulographum hederae CBS 113979]|uniref:ATP-dependent DNA helicase II subunit 2 n=1 Tax=Aulographum hederae CBS 113979 TaxID=1176131 RepID=A0A6G1GWM5_9PEZI|nr:putative Ku family DNA helicase [Aulographum hederae CBS 113979]